jgi:hypothetical protein
MAGWTGLEPAASAVTGRRYNQLNYHPAWVPRVAYFLLSVSRSTVIRIRARGVNGEIWGMGKFFWGGKRLKTWAFVPDIASF